MSAEQRCSNGSEPPIDGCRDREPWTCPDCGGRDECAPWCIEAELDAQAWDLDGAADWEFAP